MRSGQQCRELCRAMGGALGKGRRLSSQGVGSDGNGEGRRNMCMSRNSEGMPRSCQNSCIYVWLRVYVYMCMYVFICMYVCMHVNVCVVCVCVYMVLT